MGHNPNYTLQQQQLQQQAQQQQVQVQHQQQPPTPTHAHHHQQQPMHSPAAVYDDIPRNPSVEPGFHTVSAILFDPEAERARLVDIMCRPSHKPTEGICPVPMVHAHFPDNIAEGIVLTQGLNGEPLRFPLNLWYSPTCLQKNAPVNRAIAHVTAGANAKPWCGPVVVLKFNGSRRQGYADAGSNDLPALSAYFLAYK